MATIRRELSKKTLIDGKSEVILRLTVGRGLQPRLKSGIFIERSRFNDGKKDPQKAGAIIMPRANQKEVVELRALESRLIAAERFLINLCATVPRENLSKDFIDSEFNRYLHPENYATELRTATIYDTLEQFLILRSLSECRAKQYRVLIRALKRFEAYRGIIAPECRAITLDELKADDINDFDAFLRAEPEIAEKYPEIYITNPADTHKVRKTRKPLPKGNNTLVCLFKALRAFFNWCNKQGLTDNKPFAKYSGVTAEHYGTPYYISVEERDRIADFDLSSVPALEVQRDIFIFHCLIGCRVSDLIRLTHDNIINGGLEYIASKTKDERPDVIRVPLHPRAAAIIEKYAGAQDGRLLPFISPQKYNDAIKAIFTKCGVTRPVTVLNPTTGKEEQRPINEIASSHIARRTFVGNLYKRVKDPNLVGKLSGHKEGSKAFARYRDIDEDMRRELINLL